jgi:hypothetical protein
MTNEDLIAQLVRIRQGVALLQEVSRTTDRHADRDRGMTLIWESFGKLCYELAYCLECGRPIPESASIDGMRGATQCEQHTKGDNQ